MMSIGFTGKWMKQAWGALYPSSCCCRWSDPWLGSLMSSPGEQGRRGSADCTRDTLQLTGSTRTSHQAGKSTGRWTLGSDGGKGEDSVAFGSFSLLWLQKSFPYTRQLILCNVYVNSLHSFCTGSSVSCSKAPTGKSTTVSAWLVKAVILLSLILCLYKITQRFLNFKYHWWKVVRTFTSA